MERKTDRRTILTKTVIKDSLLELLAYSVYEKITVTAVCREAGITRATFYLHYQNLDEVKEHYTRGGLGDMKCKKFLINVLNDRLEPIRARRHAYEQDIPEVFNILKKGSEVARQAAAQTLHEMKEAMKINYFEDAALIAEQAKKYQ